MSHRFTNILTILEHILVKLSKTQTQTHVKKYIQDLSERMDYTKNRHPCFVKSFIIFSGYRNYTKVITRI